MADDLLISVPLILWWPERPSPGLLLMDLVGYIITGAANILFLLSLGPWGTKRRLLWRLSSKMKSEVLESVRTHCSKIFLVFFFFSGKIIESPTLLSEASLMGSDSEPVI